MVTLVEDLSISGIVLEKGVWLEHMFLSPDCIGQQIGRHMIAHLTTICLELGIKEIHVLADPNARGFYEKMGFRYQREYPSTISGRTTPYLRLEISPEVSSTMPS
jgi:GNAT superfamily N-acetyltransferase